MRRLAGGVIVVLALGPVATHARAGDTPESTIWVTDATAPMDSGWVVQFPTGSSDYFNVAHAVVPGIPNTGEVAEGLAVTGVAVSVADFGSGRTFPIAGVFASNLALDASGFTPDLASPISAVHSPTLVPPPLYGFVPFETPERVIPSGATRVHAVVQLPPGDPGLLTVGAQDSGIGSGTSAFSKDGYATAATRISWLDFGLNVGQDDSTTTSCKLGDRKPHGRLRVSSGGPIEHGKGDVLATAVKVGDPFELAFFGPQLGDRLRLYVASGCTGFAPIGPPLATLADGDGDGSYLRIGGKWPHGFGGATYSFAAAWGNPACATPGVGFTNCVTVVTGHPFGKCDDGTVETPFVVHIPTHSSDYCNNDFGNGAGQNGVVGLTIAVLDFGTTAAGYTTSGVSNANTAVDPGGHTPDLANPLATVSPFTFPPGSFETTSLAFTRHAVSIPGGALGANVHAWVQFPPGDSGLLAIGADSNSGDNGCSFFTLDGYSSPALSWHFANWCIRLKTN